MILMDVHPAEVQLPDGERLEAARVSLTDSRVRVWRAVGRESVLVLDEAQSGVRLETRWPLIGTPVEIPTGVGPVTVTRMRGCGCGSPLKALRPPAD